MGEVRKLKDMLDKMGMPPELSQAFVGMADATMVAGHRIIDEDPDDSLFGAFEAIQRVMDRSGTIRTTCEALGIHAECAKRIGRDYEHPIAARVAQVGRELQHAMIDLHKLLMFETPVELLDRIKAAHAPKEETDGEEGKGKVEEETELPSDSDEGRSTDPEAVADQQQA